MIRLLWLGTISKQELCHLMLRISMVSCPHTFIKINIKNSKVSRLNLVSIYDADAILESNNTTEEKQRDGETKINNTLENMKTLDIRDCYMKLCYRSLRLEFKTENHYHDFINMSLYMFSKIFYAGKNLEARS